MKEKVKVLGFVGLIITSIVALSAVVSKCHDVYEKSKEVKEQSDLVQKTAEELKNIQNKN